MRRWLSWLGVISAMLAGCTPPERTADETPRAVQAPLDGPLHATLVGKINPQTLATVRGFGTQFALEGNTLAVGVEQFDDGAPRLGAIFVLERKLDEFEQVDVLGLVPRSSSLGGMVALDGPRLAATELDGFIGHRIDVYERRGARFQPDGKLVPAGQIPVGFAASVAVSKDTIAVGSTVFAEEQGAGSVLVFVRGPAGGWSEQTQVVPAGQPVKNFGQVVALENDLLAVGFMAVGSGPCVWLFERIGGVWREQSRLAPPDGSGRDRFGQALAISAGRVYVGAPGALVEDRTAGAVYEYTKIDGQWLESVITLQSGADGAEFGASLSASWPRLLVGALAENVSGAAYVFTAEAGEWDQDPAHIVNPDPTSVDEFGRGVALEGGTAVIGAPYNDTHGPDRGIAYSYAIGLEPGSKCTTSADCAGWCVSGICCNKRCDGACETCQGSSGFTVDGECEAFPFYTEAPGCLPMLCGGVGTCPTDCRGGAGCAATHFCDQTNGQCVARGGPGAACKEDGECVSGSCDDGICCDQTCDVCFSCRSPHTGVSEGTCAPVIAGTDPHFACEPDPGFPTNCRADGKCDGTGKCRIFAPPTTPCGAEPAQCQGDTISGELCNGLGGCGEGRASCAPNECRDGFCTESCRDDRDCADKAFCTAAKSCVPKRANGIACERDLECLNGYCTDGVCCSSRCHGQCEWCQGDATVGTCTAKRGDAPPGRPPCSPGGATNACAMTECDGNDRGACKAVVTECGAYGCEDGRCRQSCTRRTSSADCAPGATCNSEGRCVEIQSCNLAKCSPYACDETGACVRRCTSSLECAGGHSCTSKGECVRRVESPPFGCACQVVTPRAEPLAWWLGAVFALGSRRRRRSASR
jgi:MYXO-CTERM domain-containing protein